MIFLASILPHTSPTSHDACYLNHKSSVSLGNGKQWWSRLKYGEIRLSWLLKKLECTMIQALKFDDGMCTRTHTQSRWIYTIGQWNLPAKSIHPLMSHNLPWFPPAIPASPSHCAFRHHKGDYTGAKILRDQLINAIFKARIYMSRALNRASDQHCLLFHKQFDLHIQQQINFCSFHLGNKKANYHSKEQRLPRLSSMHTKSLHFNGSGKDRGSCML